MELPAGFVCFSDGSTVQIECCSRSVASSRRSSRRSKAASSNGGGSRRRHRNTSTAEEISVQVTCLPCGWMTDNGTSSSRRGSRSAGVEGPFTTGPKAFFVSPSCRESTNDKGRQQLPPPTSAPCSSGQNKRLKKKSNRRGDASECTERLPAHRLRTRDDDDDDEGSSHRCNGRRRLESDDGGVHRRWLTPLPSPSILPALEPLPSSVEFCLNNEAALCDLIDMLI